ncbi:hypothetical protein BC830DRAFT_1214029 [Chytriomyces sp. MP71]|nr:hypothetical protein BC830DRAFT_1214029 [Chytriomyces sp. MP71]
MAGAYSGALSYMQGLNPKLQWNANLASAAPSYCTGVNDFWAGVHGTPAGDSGDDSNHVLGIYVAKGTNVFFGVNVMDETSAVTMLSKSVTGSDAIQGSGATQVYCFTQPCGGSPVYSCIFNNYDTIVAPGSQCGVAVNGGQTICDFRGGNAYPGANAGGSTCTSGFCMPNAGCQSGSYLSPNAGCVTTPQADPLTLPGTTDEEHQGSVQLWRRLFPCIRDGGPNGIVCDYCLGTVWNLPRNSLYRADHHHHNDHQHHNEHHDNNNNNNNHNHDINDHDPYHDLDDHRSNYYDLPPTTTTTSTTTTTVPPTTTTTTTVPPTTTTTTTVPPATTTTTSTLVPLTTTTTTVVPTTIIPTTTTTVIPTSVIPTTTTTTTTTIPVASGSYSLIATRSVAGGPTPRAVAKVQQFIENNCIRKLHLVQDPTRPQSPGTPVFDNVNATFCPNDTQASGQFGGIFDLSPSSPYNLTSGYNSTTDFSYFIISINSKNPIVRRDTVQSSRDAWQFIYGGIAPAWVSPSPAPQPQPKPITTDAPQPQPKPTTQQPKPTTQQPQPKPTTQQPQPKPTTADVPQPSQPKPTSKEPTPSNLYQNGVEAVASVGTVVVAAALLLL